MNKSKAGPMRPETKMRLVNRAARYLEQEAKEYKLMGKEWAVSDPPYSEECGHRAAKLTAAARTLRNLRL
jgi:hypothetical protein